jgi:hypothetical protein
MEPKSIIVYMSNKINQSKHNKSENEHTLEDYVDMIAEIKQLENTRGYLLPPDK